MVCWPPRYKLAQCSESRPPPGPSPVRLGPGGPPPPGSRARRTTGPPPGEGRGARLARCGAAGAARGRRTGSGSGTTTAGRRWAPRRRWRRPALEDVLGPGLAAQEVAQGTVDPLEQRRAQQQPPHRCGLAVQHLGEQVLGHRALAARELGGKAVGIGVGGERQGGAGAAPQPSPRSGCAAWRGRRQKGAPRPPGTAHAPRRG